MHQQDALAVQVHDRAVVEQRAAGLGGESATDQEVAIAVNEKARHASVRQAAQRGHDVACGGGGVVVAQPGFEQVAEDVERTGLPRRLPFQESMELPRDRRHRRVQVQVRDQQRLRTGRDVHGVEAVQPITVRGW